MAVGGLLTTGLPGYGGGIPLLLTGGLYVGTVPATIQPCGTPLLVGVAAATADLVVVASATATLVTCGGGGANDVTYVRNVFLTESGLPILTETGDPFGLE